MGVINKIVGTHSQRELKRHNHTIEKILSLKPEMEKLTDDEMKAKTTEFRNRLQKGETLDDLLPEAFALVREATRRTLGTEHYPCQLQGGIILHQGRIAEMKTGEGKTQTCLLPAYLNALEGKGVHIVTVNEYLATRDAEWMGQVHRFLGLTVGCVLSDMEHEEKKAAYNCDITYITNNELGFDYLRDNMVVYKEQLVQRGLHYCIIDEVDSVLIDEARTPLIISGQSGKSTKLYEMCDILARQMERGTANPELSKMDAIMGVDIEEDGDFLVNEKDKIVTLTAQGIEKVEKFFHIDNYADAENLELQHNVILALRAHNLMHRDQDYVVKDDEVLIVDEFTGRIMPGRRYSDGLHQAIEAKEHVKVKRESKTLATINIQSPVEVTPEQCKLEDIYTEDALEMIKRLEFKSMIQRFGSVTSTNDCEGGFKYINNPFDADPIFEQAENADNVGIFIYRNKDNFGVSLCFNNDNVYYIGKEGFVTEDYIIEKVRDLVNAKAKLTILNIKENNDILENDDAESIFDISIAAYLLNPLQNTYDYDDIAREYLRMNVPAFDEIFPKTKKSETPSDEIPENILKYACYNAYVAYKAKDALTEKLKETEMLDIYNNVEIPLTYALYDMEQAGIMVAGDKLKEYGERLKTGIDALEKDIFAEAGHEFNINSPKQLGEILFGEMQLPGGKKTKTGYSTSASVLEKLEPDYPFVSKILEYRQLAKLKSTYADGLAVYIGEDNRIHGKFNQTITATGRISSTEPNLQNIPVRMPLGREIRKVFIPKEGCVFIDADYSQIELRILAHMSDDQNLIDAYNHSKDIHAATASLVFHVPLEEVTKEQRSNAKAVNFGIVYGISSFGLSNDLSISRKEAEQYIKDYFISYPGIKNYLDNSVKEAKEKGYSVTMFGRRRPIPELTSGNFMQRQFGERVAMNSPIQGSAADIMKIAMINVAKELKEKDLKSKIVLQVHDELLIEAYENEVEQVKDILKRNMEQAAHLNVPLDVDVQVGNNWDEAH